MIFRIRHCYDFLNHSLFKEYTYQKYEVKLFLNYIVDLEDVRRKRNNQQALKTIAVPQSNSELPFAAGISE